MRRTCVGAYFCALCAIFLAATALAQRAGTTFERLDVADTAVGFAEATLDPAGLPQIRACQGRVETAQIRYRFDGGAVTATTGILLEIGDVVDIANHADASAVRFVKTGSTTGVVQAMCWP